MKTGSYDSIGYSLAIHFNSMFLAYCSVLELSFYALAGSFMELPTAEIARRHGPRTPVKATVVMLLLKARSLSCTGYYDTANSVTAWRFHR